jgi:hypothetical protein
MLAVQLMDGVRDDDCETEAVVVSDGVAVRLGVREGSGEADGDAEAIVSSNNELPDAVVALKYT